jgi:hypothetical protein
MILPDVNTLLYAVNSASDQRALALRALWQGFNNLLVHNDNAPWNDTVVTLYRSHGYATVASPDLQGAP